MWCGVMYCISWFVHIYIHIYIYKYYRYTCTDEPCFHGSWAWWVNPAILWPKKDDGPIEETWQSTGFVWKCWVNLPNEIAIYNWDNDQQNHWVKRGTQHFQTIHHIYAFTWQIQLFIWSERYTRLFGFWSCGFHLNLLGLFECYNFIIDVPLERMPLHIKPVYPCCSHHNRLCTWMFVPSIRLTLVGLDPFASAWPKKYHVYCVCVCQCCCIFVPWCDVIICPFPLHRKTLIIRCTLQTNDINQGNQWFVFPEMWCFVDNNDQQ